MASNDVVFSCGGIGATPDDHTRQAAAMAAGVELIQHPEATRLIEARFGESAHPNRIKMAQLPEGCRLIPNPVNQVAGFSVGHHHFLPGFPEMAWPMLTWVLDNQYAGLGRPRQTVGFIVPGAKEGDLIGLMGSLVVQWPDTAFSSLPSYGNARYPSPHIEFSVTGEPAAAQAAAAWLQRSLEAMGYVIQA
jgi:molybdopterin-biosynthesis enzyme MoeA-like protein